MIRNFLPKPNELIELSIQYNEGLRGFGYRCILRNPLSVDLPEVGYKQNISYSDHSLEVYISPEQRVTPKLLQKYGWNIEDDDNKPLIVYMSRYIQPTHQTRDVRERAIPTNPEKYSRITLDYDYKDYGKEFIVTDVNANNLNPVYYVLKLAPYRPDIPENPTPNQDVNLSRLDADRSGFKFLNLDRKSHIPNKY